MARARSRRSRRGRRPRGKRNSNTFTIISPIITQVKEGEEIKLSFNDLFIKGSASILTNVCWKLVSVKAEVGLVNLANTDPGMIQIGLHSGQTTNVEMVSWMRFLVGSVPRTRVLRMRSPNLWKEEESKSQVIISIKNLGQGSSVNNMISVLLETKVVFNGQPYPSRSGLGIPVYISRASEAKPSSPDGFEMI